LHKKLTHFFNTNVIRPLQYINYSFSTLQQTNTFIQLMKTRIMRKLTMFLIFAILGGFVLLSACSDDEEAKPTAPTVSAPTINLTVPLGGSVDVDFGVTIPGGFKSSAVSASNGSAVKSTDLTVGATSGTATITFTADDAAGAASVTLTVTDNSNQTANATAVITVEEEENSVTVTDNISEDVTWTKDKIWILAGRITVLDGATLTIEAGTVVKGDEGAEADAKALMVARGGMLMAEGTAEAPIIFTSAADDITPEDVANGDFASPNLPPDVDGLWGGVLILGKARISATNDLGDDVVEQQIEGIPTSDTNGLYGGTEDDDNSGTITYISIRHGGTNIGAGNEINGLTLGGVGSGTTIENVEIVANQDDGIEWFGGTVSVTNAVIWNVGDDAIDTDQAWAGSVSNFLVVTPGDRGFELDGPEGSYTSPNHQIHNGTVFMGDGVELIDFDDNTDVDIYDIYFYGLDEGQVVSGYSGFEAAGVGSATNFEVTLYEGGTIADVFVDMPAQNIVEVAENANTVGPPTSEGFEWTWASQSGALGSIGL
jgi:hypothetical protein